MIIPYNLQTYYTFPSKKSGADLCEKNPADLL